MEKDYYVLKVLSDYPEQVGYMDGTWWEVRVSYELGVTILKFKTLKEATGVKKGHHFKQ